VIVPPRPTILESEHLHHFRFFLLGGKTNVLWQNIGRLLMFVIQARQQIFEQLEGSQVILLAKLLEVRRIFPIPASAWLLSATACINRRTTARLSFPFLDSVIRSNLRYIIGARQVVVVVVVVVVAGRGFCGVGAQV